MLLRPSSQSGDATSNGEIRRITLGVQEIRYTLVRRKRKTIGMKIDGDGLTVVAPPRESLRWIEGILRERAAWVLKKLNEWERKKPAQLEWKEGAVFPLLGRPHQLTAALTGGVRLCPLAPTDAGQLALPFAPLMSEAEIEQAVMAWYRREALICFEERTAHYAKKLNLPLPRLKLSTAKTQWGSCNARRIVHLNWRLIQLPIHLIDYVVVHELAHLIEMNHSPAFWKTVASVYPSYVAARKELKKLA